jgi:hypothetical protein
VLFVNFGSEYECTTDELGGAVQAEEIIYIYGHCALFLEWTATAGGRQRRLIL